MNLRNLSIAHARTRVTQTAPATLAELKKQFIDGLSESEQKFYTPLLYAARLPTRFIVWAAQVLGQDEQER
jgi:hypothetical protein